jgi:outer membrane biosynthesis protein TonB
LHAGHKCNRGYKCDGYQCKKACGGEDEKCCDGACLPVAISQACASALTVPLSLQRAKARGATHSNKCVCAEPRDLHAGHKCNRGYKCDEHKCKKVEEPKKPEEEHKKPEEEPTKPEEKPEEEPKKPEEEPEKPEEKPKEEPKKPEEEPKEPEEPKTHD